MHLMFRCFNPPPHSSLATTGRGINVDGSGGPARSGFRDVTSVCVRNSRIGSSPLCFAVNVLKSPGMCQFTSQDESPGIRVGSQDRPVATVVILRVTDSLGTAHWP